MSSVFVGERADVFQPTQPPVAELRIDVEVVTDAVLSSWDVLLCLLDGLESVLEIDRRGHERLVVNRDAHGDETDDRGRGQPHRPVTLPARERATFQLFASEERVDDFSINILHRQRAELGFHNGETLQKRRAQNAALEMFSKALVVHSVGYLSL